MSPADADIEIRDTNDLPVGAVPELFRQTDRVEHRFRKCVAVALRETDLVSRCGMGIAA